MMPSEHFLEVSGLKQLYMEGLIMRMGYARFEAILEDLKRALNLGTATITAASLTATAGDIDIDAGTIHIKNGATVTQASNKSTTVVANADAGKITMNAAALAADAIVTFTVTCSEASASDVCIVNHHSGGTVGKYSVDATGHAAGSFKVTVTNISAGSLSEAIVLHFALIKTLHT